MRKVISDEVLSIVREMIGLLDTANTTLPSSVVEAMVDRIDYQDKLIRAHRVLVDCYDECLRGGGVGFAGIRCVHKIASARQVVADLEK